MAEKKIIAKNKAAYHEYFVIDSFEAGAALCGTEVKSIRGGRVNLKDSFCRIENGELIAYGIHISPYEKGNIFNRDPYRPRKLLMHRREIDRLSMDESEKLRRMESLQYQIDELTKAHLRPGEEEELNARRELLRNGEKYIAALSGADYCLSGDDNGAGAVSAIREAEEALRGIRTLSDELGELYKRLESIRCEVYDLAETIRDKRAEFAFSPAELDAAEARTDQLYRLKKKYGATVEDMIAYLEQCRSELDAMETADDTLILLNGKLKKAEAVVRAAGAELTQKRKAAAQALEQRIQSELRDLDMNKVRFAIEFTEKEPAADGCDVIRFLMSANAGEDLRPIAKIASGGELARIMLALKNVLAEQESIATLENLYGVDVSYYARINFYGLKDIVDAVGGIDVVSPLSFTLSTNACSKSGDIDREVVEGVNHMDGAKALAFARERYGFADGDNQRGKNQMAILQALTAKLTKASTLVNYQSILAAVSNNMTTNLSYEDITALVRTQLTSMSEWKIDTYAVTQGSGSTSQPCYSLGGAAAWVMPQNEASVQTAREMIQNVLNGTEDSQS